MGGILALVVAFGIVFGAHKLCDLIRAPRWFAKYLFICAALIATYFLAEGVVPESKKSWGIWVALLGAATGIIPVGLIMFKHLEEEGEDDRKA
jgi:hypothetical protein